jgi:hypothetical protein
MCFYTCSDSKDIDNFKAPIQKQNKGLGILVKFEPFK